MENFKQLIVKAQNNDELAKEKLVIENTSLVWALVHRFNNSTYDKEELFQIGCVGLIKAINKFDVSYDVTFSTYAVPIIIGEIKRHFRDDGAIKVSRSIKELNQKIMKLFKAGMSSVLVPLCKYRNGKCTEFYPCGI